MKLLLGHDGSECADAAIDDLRRGGLPEHGEAVVLTAADLWPHLTQSSFHPQEPLPLDSMFWFGPAPANAKAMAERAWNEAQAVCAGAMERLGKVLPSWEIHAEPVCGAAHTALVKKADAWRPDLLVVGSNGRSLMGRLTLGSVSLQVVTHASCSVRIVHPRTRGEGPLRLIVGVDGSAEAASAVSTVARRNWPSGTAVRVVSMLHPGLASAVPVGGASPLGWPFSPDEDPTSGINRIVVSAVQELREANLEAEPIVREGNPKTELVQVAEDWNADCIFVGAKGLSRLERFLLGGVSTAVATRAQCTVEVVRRW